MKRDTDPSEGAESASARDARALGLAARRAACARSCATRGRRRAPPPGAAPGRSVDPSERSVPANRRAETVVAGLLLPAAVFGFGFTAVYVALDGEHAAARARDRRRAGAARRRRDRRRQAGRPAGDRRGGARRTARCGADRGGRRDDRVRRRGDLAAALLTGAGGARRRGAPHRGGDAAGLARPDADGDPRHAVAARGAAGRRPGQALPGAARSRSARSTRRCPSTATPSRSAPACWWCRLPADSSTCPPARRGWAPDGILAYSKICPHAGCAISLYRYPTYAPTSTRPGLHLPVPLLDVLARRGRAAAVRSRRARAAAAAADDRRQGLPARRRPVPRGHRPVVVERAPRRA